MISYSLFFIDAELASKTSSNPEVKALVSWLESIPVGQDTINKVNSAEAQTSFEFTHAAGWYYSLSVHTCGILFSSCSLMSSPWTHFSTWPLEMT